MSRAAIAPRSRRRLLVALASTVAATVVAGGPGATFASEPSGDGSFATGSLSVSSGEPAAVLTAVNLEPGDTLTGVVTIANPGSLPAAMTLVETSVRHDSTPSDPLVLTVTDVTDGAQPEVVSAAAPLGSLGSLRLGSFGPGEERAYELRLAHVGSADDGQDLTAGATYTWNGVHDENGTVR